MLIKINKNIILEDSELSDQPTQPAQPSQPTKKTKLTPEQKEQLRREEAVAKAKEMKYTPEQTRNLTVDDIHNHHKLWQQQQNLQNAINADKNSNLKTEDQKLKQMKDINFQFDDMSKRVTSPGYNIATHKATLLPVGGLIGGLAGHDIVNDESLGGYGDDAMTASGALIGAGAAGMLSNHKIPEKVLLNKTVNKATSKAYSGLRNGVDTAIKFAKGIK